MTNKSKTYRVWKEIPPERPAIGFKIWMTGGEIYLGKLHYRAYWRHR